MNPLAMFKKPAEPIAPARGAFNAQLAAYREKAQQRQRVIEQDAATRHHREAADAAAARVPALRAAIDQSIADNLYGDGAAADLAERRRELATAEAEAERLAPVGRAADIQHQRFSSQSATIANEMNKLYEPVPRLLHAALIEQLEHEAAAFRAAEDEFRAQHRTTFVRVAAADMLAKAHGFGVFFGWGLFGDLHISRPSLPGYQCGPTDPWQAKLAYDASLRSLDAEGEALINAMLNSEAAG